MAARYSAATGADLELAYYRAFNSWKTACIVHGVYARYQAGQKSTEGVDLAGLRSRVFIALDAAAASLRARAHMTGAGGSLQVMTAPIPLALEGALDPAATCSTGCSRTA